ncbi:MAG: ATP-binding cassette domain-containing protein [Neisseriaceae bacterium]|nr:ATP-binding cassette domain-containing protein [Neisseriaceae bacterium]
MAIQLNNICKKYGNQTIIDNITLTLEKGKIISFIGANGAGKSTLLNIMSRLLKADSGEIYLDGTALNNLKSEDIAKKLSILKQNNYVGLKLTVAELVAFGRFPYSAGNLKMEDKKIIDEAIEYLDLQKLRNHYINELSGGQKQRAFIAMILAQDTNYILLDEPLNNLDMKHSLQIMQVLHKLCIEKNKTIILVIHDINFASVYSDEIFALKNGRLIFSGRPKKLMNSETLNQIFDFNIPVYDIDQHKLGLYFIANK